MLCIKYVERKMISTNSNQLRNFINIYYLIQKN